MQDWEYLQPNSTDALAHLLREGGGKLLAGGTDLIPGLRRGRVAPSRVIDLSRIEDLKRITLTDRTVRIGALVTHAQIASSHLLQQQALVLVKAAETIGCRQTRERGTIGGNLANASPAADLAPALLVLDAQVDICSLKSERVAQITHFFAAPGKTCLADDEFITGVHFTLPDRKVVEDFQKLGRRNAMAIAVASAAALLAVGDNGRIALARLAMGSVAPCPVRCGHVEAALKECQPGIATFRAAAEHVCEDIAPISDTRATAAYRSRVAPVLIERALSNAYQQIGGTSAGQS